MGKAENCHRFLINIPNALWGPLKAKAKAEGSNVAAAVNRLIGDYIGDDDYRTATRRRIADLTLRVEKLEDAAKIGEEPTKGEEPTNETEKGASASDEE